MNAIYIVIKCVTHVGACGCCVRGGCLSCGKPFIAFSWPMTKIRRTLKFTAGGVQDVKDSCRFCGVVLFSSVNSLDCYLAKQEVRAVATKGGGARGGAMT